ncbi:MAG TPA: hypothetical protein VGI45_25705 [Terracidiphilus sp.]|jgi:hypothetical protein
MLIGNRDRAAGVAHLLGGMALLFAAALRPASAEAPAPAERVYSQYVAKVEARLAQQHLSPNAFIVGQGSNSQLDARVRRGEAVIEHLSSASEADPPGALLHHWRGTAFVPGATAADFERLMKNFNSYPQRFTPQAVKARILSSYSGAIPDHFAASMRVRQKHVITVVMDTTYDVTFVRLDPRHGYSISRSTKIDEISSPGTSKERVLLATEEHGFLWRLNTYWTYGERDGGLYMQIETISLTRAIPTGLGWAVRPYVESVPRESLEFTLRATCRALEDTRRDQGR